MTRIHMETEVVQETARLLDWSCGELYYMPPKLKNLAVSLSSAWQGGRSGQYTHELQHLGELLQQEVINLQRLAVRVRNEVGEWEDADAAFGKVVSAIATAPENPGAPWWNISETIRGVVEDIRTVGSGLAISGLIGGIGAGTSYAGQLVFTGSQGLKEMAGLSGHLTHINVANFPNHLLKQANKLGALEIGMAAWEFSNQAGKDWAQYESGSEKTVALGIDALFVTAKTAIMHYGAYAITAAAVGLVAGAPVVAAGVGLAVWWSSSYLIESAIDVGYKAAESSGVKKSIIKAGGSLPENIGKEIQKAAKAVNHAFDPVIRSAQVYEV